MTAMLNMVEAIKVSLGMADAITFVKPALSHQVSLFTRQ